MYQLFGARILNLVEIIRQKCDIWQFWENVMFKRNFVRCGLPLDGNVVV
jgi:hypothetical protein